jgi:predicted small lipoprotein YifL
MRSLLLVLAFAALLQGCGLRGPLYISTPDEERELAERKRRLEERERERGRQQGKPVESVPDQAEPVEKAAPVPAPERPRPAVPPTLKPQPPPVQ